MKQIVTVELHLKKDQDAYRLMEQHGKGPYEALKHFFEDIGYEVSSITSEKKEQ